MRRYLVHSTERVKDALTKLFPSQEEVDLSAFLLVFFLCIHGTTDYRHYMMCVILSGKIEDFTAKFHRGGGQTLVNFIAGLSKKSHLLFNT